MEKNNKISIKGFKLTIELESLEIPVGDDQSEIIAKQTLQSILDQIQYIGELIEHL